MSSRFEKFTNVIVTLAIVTAAAVLVANRVSPSQATGEGPVRLEQVRDWGKRTENVAVSIESPAKVQQIEHAYYLDKRGGHVTLPKIEVTSFSDFECPACRMFDSITAGYASKSSNMVRNIIHFPLNGHTHALAAARAFECADKQGQAKDMARELFKFQPEFGKKPWLEIATAADIDNTAEFSRCIADTTHDERIRAGIKLAGELKVTATPTFVINGWLISPTTPERIEKAINAVLRGGNPSGRGGSSHHNEEGERDR